MMKRKMGNRLISLVMIMVLALLLPLMHLEKGAEAAAKKTKYIKDVRLFIKTGSDESKAYKEAEGWCASQKENTDDKKDNDWKVIRGDLNAGAGGKKKHPGASVLSGDHGSQGCHYRYGGHE